MVLNEIEGELLNKKGLNFKKAFVINRASAPPILGVGLAGDVRRGLTRKVIKGRIIDHKISINFAKPNRR